MTAAAPPVKVLIADDHALFRAGLARVLSGFSRIDVVGQARDGAEAVEQSLARKPDVVLMDLDMPNVTGVEAVQRLTQVAPSVRVLAVSAFASTGHVNQALAGGARGFVSKDISPEEIVSEILAVSNTDKTRRRPASVLSDRERHVLKQVAEGLSNKQIAKRLEISEATVRNHLSRIFIKLRATNRTEAVMNAIRAGVLLTL